MFFTSHEKEVYNQERLLISKNPLWLSRWFDTFESKLVFCDEKILTLIQMYQISLTWFVVLILTGAGWSFRGENSVDASGDTAASEAAVTRVDEHRIGRNVSPTGADPVLTAFGV